MGSDTANESNVVGSKTVEPSDNVRHAVGDANDNGAMEVLVVPQTPSKQTGTTAMISGVDDGVVMVTPTGFPDMHNAGFDANEDSHDGQGDRLVKFSTTSKPVHSHCSFTEPGPTQMTEPEKEDVVMASPDASPVRNSIGVAGNEVPNGSQGNPMVKPTTSFTVS